MAEPSPAEKSVKILLENHRLVLTLVGFFIAGLFAYAGRGANVIDGRYIAALGLLAASGFGVCFAVAVAITQANNDSYNPHDRWMTVPYLLGLLCLLCALLLVGWIMIRPANISPSVADSGSGQITLEGGLIVINRDSGMDVTVEHDAQTGKLVRVTLTSKKP